MMTYLHSYLDRRSDCCIFMSIFTNDLKTIQAAFVTFIRPNGANRFNMAIKSSGHDRGESWSLIIRAGGCDENEGRSLSFRLKGCYCRDI